MTPSQIITGFARSRKLPRQAIRAALERRDEVVPEFLRILTGLAGGERLSKDEEDAVFLIVHVLGEMRETRAFQPLMALLRRRRDLIDLLLGDAITVTLPDILI
ncbi:MAG TPA: DUF1186 domain-containing protein, partial [Pararhizobium sp.]|nr:DUF1186 domain-containing protein [Pararhizobium sp.]